MKIAVYGENILKTKDFLKDYINFSLSADHYTIFSSKYKLVNFSKEFDVILVYYENNVKYMNLSSRVIYVTDNENKFDLYLYINSIRIKKMPSKKLINSNITDIYTEEQLEKYFKGYFPKKINWCLVPASRFYKFIFNNYISSVLSSFSQSEKEEEENEKER